MLICALMLSLFMAQTDATAIAGRVQKVYDTELSLMADFVQIYTSGTSGRTLEESGILSLKKPGRMRWEYNKPDEKLYVSDGSTVWWYVPKDRQVTKMSLSRADQEQTQILFLMGRGDLSRDFEIGFTRDINPLQPDSYLLRLKPRKEETFDYLILEVNPRDYYVERLLSFDPLGNIMEYRFLNFRRADLPDSRFSFTPPKGVEVLDETRSK